MRVLLVLGLLWLAMAAAARADEQQVEQFDGHNSLTTADFTIPDHWEIRWHSAQALSLGVIRLDNTVVAGATGMTNGSLYLPRGGTFRIRVKGQDPIPWDVVVVTLGPAPPEGAETETPEATTGSETTVFYVPTSGPDEATNGAPEEENAPTPAPATNTPPAAPAPPPVPTQLTPDQQRAILVVKGDRAQGLGFVVQTPTGPVIMTALSLLANNPGLAVTTAAGEEIKTTTLRGAPDRDVAMIGIDESFNAKLPPVTDFGAVQPGDAVLTSANGVAATTPPQTAQVVGIAPLRLDFGSFDSHGPVGGPVIQAKTGQVIGMVDSSPQVAITTDLQKTSFPTRERAVANSVSFFGVRFDTVANWETYDGKRLATETLFLDLFHQHSRSLDSYLNPQRNDHRPNARLFLTDDKIKTANDNFIQSSAGGDASQRMESLRNLLFELGTAADIDMDQIQQPANFYTFDQQRARDEIAYRQALKSELDYDSTNLPRFSGVIDRDNQPVSTGD